jgi:hypothetical protein
MISFGGPARTLRAALVNGHRVGDWRRAGELAPRRKSSPRWKTVPRYQAISNS